MIIEAGQNSIVLVPETEWERETLKALTNRSIKKIEWRDSWNSKGPLIISFPTEDESWRT